MSKASCLNCSRFLTCTYPNKRGDYSCGKWQEVNIKNFNFDLTDASSKGKASVSAVAVLTKKQEESKILDLVSMLDEILDPNAPLPPDLKIDDRDLPEAPNVWEFVYNKRWGFKDMIMFSRQMYTALMLYGEVCPRCSNPKWIKSIENVPVDYLASEMPEHLCMLRKGVCPKCKVTRHELYAKKELYYHDELAGMAGQRCVIGNTNILTSDGLMRIKEYASHRNYGFSPMNVLVHNGEKLENTSQFYRAKPENIFKLVSNGNHKLEGTKDHPVQLHDGSFKRLKDITTSDIIRIEVNQQQFGNKYITRGYVETEMKKRLGDKFKESFLKQDFDVFDADIYTVLGVWVAEGRRASFTNYDQELLEFCETTYKKYINTRYISRSETVLSLLGTLGYTFLSVMLGLDSNKQLLSGSARKEVPYCVRTGTKEHQVAFLRGLFEGDGSVGTKERSYGGVSYCTISKQLSEDVSSMLFNLGVYHRLRHRWTWATNGTEKQVSKRSYNIVIRGNVYLKRFKDQIGFMSKRKNSLLDFALSKYETIHINDVPFLFENINFIKPRLADLLRSVRDSLAVFQLDNTNSSFNYKTRLIGLGTIFQDFSSLYGFSVRKLISNNQRVVTKNKLQKICHRLKEYKAYLTAQQNAEIDLLMSYTSENVIYEKVRFCKITDKVEETYDFTLPITHKFFTNGFISHNSGKSALVSGLLTPYQTHKYLKISDPARLFTRMPNYTLQGTFVALTYGGAYELLWSPFYFTVKEVSQWFCLAKGTPVTLANGATASIEETLGREVKTFEGSGLVTVVADTGIQECLNLELENGQSLVGTAEHRVRCLGPDGNSLVWKTIGELTEDDFIVVEG